MATITLSQSSGGRPATSSRRSSTSGWASSVCLHGGGEAVAVDGQRAAGRQLVRVGRAHDQRAGAPHLLVQQADGVVGGIVGAEGVGADQLGEVFGEMRLGAAHRPHLVQHHGHAGRRELPRRFAAREAAADDVHAVLVLDVMRSDLKPCASLHGGANHGHQVPQSQDASRWPASTASAPRCRPGARLSLRLGPGRRRFARQAAGRHRQAGRAGLEEHRPGAEERPAWATATSSRSPPS